MKIFTYLCLLAFSALQTHPARSQDFDIHAASNAVILQVNENNHTENVLNGVTLAMQNNSRTLNIKFNLPYDSSSFKTASNDALSAAPGLVFDLKVDIDPNIQQYLTSAKTFETHGNLTLNDSTKPVAVQYLVLPALTSQAGDFNLSVVIQFTPADFNIYNQYANSSCIIKIGNTPVNRL